MRLSGTLRSWNDGRGFGFIAQTNGGPDLFLHISELPKDGSRPTLGEKLTYEMGRGKDGKPQAMNVIRLAFGDTRNIKRMPARRQAHSSGNISKIIALVVVLSLGSYGYKHYAKKMAAYSTTADYSPPPAVQPVMQQSAPNGYHCDGRKYCSQMTSCAEAKFFLQNCPGTEMDGDHDGTPCEKQWCTSPLAK